MSGRVERCPPTLDAVFGVIERRLRELRNDEIAKMVAAGLGRDQIAALLKANDADVCAWLAEVREPLRAFLAECRAAR